MEEGSFMELLGSGWEEGYLLDPLSSPSSSCYSSLTAAQVLCFGGKSSDSTSSLSSPSSTITTTAKTIKCSSKPSKKKASSGGGGRRETTTSSALTTSKKPKVEGSAASTAHGTIRVRKEKLGDRIMALQKLVSPFGKSDTASVLHEALGYIRFLHEQVQVLSSPYLQGSPSAAHYIQEGVGGGDLRSRGLCLVPISCTEHVAGSNGADLWSPAMWSSNNKSSSSSTH